MNGRRWFLLIVIILCAATAHAVEAVVSHVIFYKPAASGKDSAFLEVYWQINPSSLHYHKNEQGELVAQVQTAFSISSDTALLRRDRYVLQTRPQKPGAAASQVLLQYKRYYVPAGNLSFRLDLGETEFPAQNFQVIQPFNSNDIPQGPFYSQIKLLDTFFTSREPGPFSQDGYQQYPRVLNFYDEGQRTVHFYTEAYARQHVGKRLIQHFYLSRRANDYPIAQLQIYDTLSAAAEINPGRHSFNIAALPTGNYYLNAHLQNEKGGVLDTQSLFLQIVNKNPEQIKEDTAKKKTADMDAQESGHFFDMSKTFVVKFSIKQLLAILRMISPLADPAETNAINSFFKRPDEMYMRYFIYNYFSKENKAHPEEAWKEFANLIREVNREFNSGAQLGYESDRGRIYLKYGKPDERVRVPNESGAVPYEIWRYNSMPPLNQQGTLLFYQPGFAIGDYKLLTSNVIGELQNPAWKSMLYSTGQSSGNSNSRAEQYLEGK